MNEQSDDYWKVVLAGAMFLLLGLANVFDGFLTAYRILTWSKAQGTVLSSTTLGCSRGKAGQGSTPAISYSYKVNQATFVSNRIAPKHYSDCVANRDADKVMFKFPANATVLVRFNPQKPEEAFVFGGKIGQWYDPLLILGGIFCICFARYARQPISNIY